MPSLVTTKTGDKHLVDENPSTITERMALVANKGNPRSAMIELTVHRSTPKRSVWVDAFSIESLVAD